ncbi:uncharacterized protein LOC118734010 isoform X2 [Rhagoletis pomonella]|uniref:uncharacterized protein LOC118734010 isoform X2 n=1 Tax=Rhagoletis pomonella TaxID=28610 RepID=UPI001782BAC9|nr:uncharacterized protein LOC118734010 isoform X2 [Rhagoletis pomonella]
MQGAEKDVEGWKRSYNAWRLSTGKYFEEEKQRIIKDVADDDYFIINVTEEELGSGIDYDDGATYLDPKDLQLTRLHELVSKQRLLFINTSEDDEPLKQRLWQNIAEELNNIPDGIKLPKEEWQKRVDLRQYTVPRGRKRKTLRGPTKSEAPISKDRNDEPSREENVKASVSYENAYEEYIIEEFRTTDEQTHQTHTTLNNDIRNDVFAEIDDNDDDTDYVIKLLNDPRTNDVSENFTFDDFDSDDDDADFENFESINDGSEASVRARNKRAKVTPIVKAFKYSSRITTAVEKLKDDVKETKEILKQTNTLLSRMCNIMEEHNKKQDETNTQLKRNGQLLKILVEYKCGLRGTSKK